MTAAIVKVSFTLWLPIVVILAGSTPSSLAFQPNGCVPSASNTVNHRAKVVTPRSSLRSPTKLPLWNEALAAVDTFYQTAPYAAGALTCGAKASAADFVAQRRQLRTLDKRERKWKNFEMARNIAFLVYGAAYQGVAQEFIYNHCYASWFGTTSEPIVVLKKVLFDLCIQTTLVTLPVAYLTKAAIFRYSFREGLRRYKNDVLKNGLLTKYFALWGPVQCLTFGVVPEHLRITFIAAVSFFWLIILSTISARGDTKAKATASPAEEVVVPFDSEEDEIVLTEADKALLMSNTTTTSSL